MYSSIKKQCIYPRYTNWFLSVLATDQKLQDMHKYNVHRSRIQFGGKHMNYSKGGAKLDPKNCILEVYQSKDTDENAIGSCL